MKKREEIEATRSSHVILEDYAYNMGSSSSKIKVLGNLNLPMLYVPTPTYLCMQENQTNLRFDPEPERTLFRRRREARRTRQELLEQQLDMAAYNNNDGLDHEDQNQRITLGQYIHLTAKSCGSTILLD
ncbi:hypothetical protein PIB30_067615 [Stylosanthes scabra]|uniref:Uncharacterized protein n=1 Tax=Stylosanthes scabra TaxID=79078 RepID=A0ABU6QML3_9FABA|nr:hypothetical protein [Stylosanthes scabra]